MKSRKLSMWRRLLGPCLCIGLFLVTSALAASGVALEFWQLSVQTAGIFSHDSEIQAAIDLFDRTGFTKGELYRAVECWSDRVMANSMDEPQKLALWSDCVKGAAILDGNPAILAAVKRLDEKGFIKELLYEAADAWMYHVNECDDEASPFSSTALGGVAGTITRVELAKSLDHAGTGRILVTGGPTGESIYLIVTKKTRIFAPGPDGNPIKTALRDVEVGRTCKATYLGSVLESYPPQVVAAEVKVGLDTH